MFELGRHVLHQNEPQMHQPPGEISASFSVLALQNNLKTDVYDLGQEKLYLLLENQRLKYIKM